MDLLEMDRLELEIGRFVQSCRKPALSEPGQDLIDVSAENLTLETRGAGVLLHAWNGRTSLARRVVGIEARSRSRLTLTVERFGKKAGTLTLLDRERSDAPAAHRKAARLEFRERFRRFLLREFPGYRLAGISTEPDLEHSLSPAYPRALLQHGSRGIAAIAAGPESGDVDGALTFGLIWLDYLRTREARSTVRSLVLLVPEGSEGNTCLRLRFLDRDAASYALFVYAPDGGERAVDLADYGNLSTRLEPCCRSVAESLPLCRRLAETSGVEVVDSGSGAASFRVHGLEFARFTGGVLTGGLETKRALTASNGREIEALARELIRVRKPEAPDRRHPLFLRNPESWLESQVRARIDVLDPGLCAGPIYGQVPAFAAADRSVLDLLAVDRGGRLAVVEIKASEDIHLPLQALDYWIRVAWHAGRGDFASHGYFPGIELRRDPPRLFMVAPALEFHPANERVLSFFSPRIEVERVGVSAPAAEVLRVAWRAAGSRPVDRWSQSGS